MRCFIGFSVNPGGIETDALYQDTNKQLGMKDAILGFSADGNILMILDEDKHVIFFLDVHDDSDIGKLYLKFAQFLVTI